MGEVRQRSSSPAAQALQHRLAVVLDEAEADAGVVGAEGADQAGDGLGAHGVQEAEGDLARRGVGVGPYRLGGAADLGERLVDGREERAARRGERDGAAVAREQFHAEVLFEADQGARQRRLRDLELVGGPRDVLGAGDRGEVRQAWRERRHDVFCVTGW